MRRLLIASILAVILVPGCGGDTGAPATSFCTAIGEINDSFDTLTRTMLAANVGEDQGEFAEALQRTVDLLTANVARASAEKRDASQLLASAYADFAELVDEAGYDLSQLASDDPRATALTSDGFRQALITLNEGCDTQP